MTIALAGNFSKKQKEHFLFKAFGCSPGKMCGDTSDTIVSIVIIVTILAGIGGAVLLTSSR